MCGSSARNHQCFLALLKIIKLAPGVEKACCVLLSPQLARDNGSGRNGACTAKDWRWLFLSRISHVVFLEKSCHTYIHSSWWRDRKIWIYGDVGEKM